VSGITMMTVTGGVGGNGGNSGGTSGKGADGTMPGGDGGGDGTPVISGGTCTQTSGQVGVIFGSTATAPIGTSAGPGWLNKYVANGGKAGFYGGCNGGGPNGGYGDGYSGPTAVAATVLASKGCG